MIAAKDITKSYGSFEAVKRVSFTVDPGDIVGLLGPNGAGKTSIMKMLTGFHHPSSGTVRINSMDIGEEPIRVKRIVGYLPENAPLYPDLNVKEYLDFIAGARELRGRDRREKIERVVTECGLSTVMYRPIDRLSKGFRQRVGLSQAILHNPDILILDEPTNGLDPNQIMEIRSLIRTLGKEKTVILSTHILQEVEAVCNRVLILHEGRIVAQGTPEDIERGLRGDANYTLLLKGPDQEAVREALTKVRGSSRIGPVTVLDDGRVEVRVSMDPTPDAGELIFDWAVTHRLKILAMRPDHLSLEDIFVKLTREQENGSA